MATYAVIAPLTPIAVPNINPTRRPVFPINSDAKGVVIMPEINCSASGSVASELSVLSASPIRPAAVTCNPFEEFIIAWAKARIDMLRKKWGM